MYIISAYFRCIFRAFPVYFKYISRVFPLYFRCITDVKSMYTSVLIPCNIKIWFSISTKHAYVIMMHSLHLTFRGRRTDKLLLQSRTPYWATVAWHMRGKECGVLVYFNHTPKTRGFMICLLSGSKILNKISKKRYTFTNANFTLLTELTIVHIHGIYTKYSPRLLLVVLHHLHVSRNSKTTAQGARVKHGNYTYTIYTLKTRYHKYS